MIRNYYRSPYIQKGYGLGSVFRGVARFFKPLARSLVRSVNNPEVKNVFKTVGKEAFNTGSELLINSLKGNNIETKMDKRIQQAKKRIIGSIQDGITTATLSKRNKKARDNQEKEPLLTPVIDKPIKDQTKVGKYSRLHNDTDFYRRTNAYKKQKPNLTLRNIGKRRTSKSRHRTVFD